MTIHQRTRFEEAFAKLQYFIKTNQTQYINLPVKLGVYPDGSFYLEYQPSTSRVVVKDLDEAAIYIENFLKSQTNKEQTVSKSSVNFIVDSYIKKHCDLLCNEYFDEVMCKKFRTK
jgi:ribosomal protein L11